MCYCFQTENVKYISKPHSIFRPLFSPSKFQRNIEVHKSNCKYCRNAPRYFNFEMHANLRDSLVRAGHTDFFYCFGNRKYQIEVPKSNCCNIWKFRICLHFGGIEEVDALLTGHVELLAGIFERILLPVRHGSWNWLTGSVRAALTRVSSQKSDCRKNPKERESKWANAAIEATHSPRQSLETWSPEVKVAQGIVAIAARRFQNNNN